MIALWIVVGAAIGLAVASLIHASQMAKMRAKFERVADVVADRVYAEIEPSQRAQDAAVRRLASALGWAPDLETLDRFVARSPESKTAPVYLTPDGTCTGDLLAACIAWQLAAPQTLDDARHIHAQQAAAAAKGSIQ